MADQSTIPPLGGDERRGSLILAVGWLEATLALGFLLGRLYARIKATRSIGPDDWAMITSYIFALMFVCVATPEVYYGTGRHVFYLDHYERVMAVKLNWVTQAFHIISTSVGKISIVLFIMRMIGNGHKIQKWMLTIMVSALFIISVICVAFIFAQCTPAAALWDPTISGKCWAPTVQQDYGYFTASYSSFTDLVLAIFPISVLWNLQMKLRIKISLAIVMGLGVFAFAASIIKTIQLKSLSSRGDYTYDTVDLIIWMMTEQFVIIIAACIPPMRQLFVAFIDDTRLGKNRSRSRSRGKDLTSSGISSKKKGLSYYAFDFNNDDDTHNLQSFSRTENDKEANMSHAVAYHESAPPPKSGGNGSRSHPDNDSEETITPGSNPFDITKTTEVNVTSLPKSTGAPFPVDQ